MIKMPVFVVFGLVSIALLGCEKPAASDNAAKTTATTTADTADATQSQSKAKPTPRTLPSALSSTVGKEGKLDLPDLLDSKEAKNSKDKNRTASNYEGIDSKTVTNVLSILANPIAPELVVQQVITATPATLDLGTFSTSEKGTASVTLTNTSELPVTIERAKASCGCTTSDFQNGTVLLPGDSTDVSVTMNGKGRARKLTKTVTFSITGHPPLRVPVTAETVTYVTVDKNPIAITEGEAFGTIILTSIDDQPFTVTSMLPAITELPNEASATQELKLDWNLFWDVVQTTKVTIRLDHPLCSEITTSIRLTAEQRQRLNEIIKTRREDNALPTKDPTRPLSGDQLTQYIKAGKGMQVIEFIKNDLGKYDAVNRVGVALLSTAAEAGYPDTVNALIELGAQVERVDGVNRTPLMHAARSKNAETIEVLLDAGADIQARDRLGNTPLSWASGFGIADGVQVLIDAGADANTVDSVLGYTPLIWASGFGDPVSISILIEAGADVTVNDFAEGRTPLMHAVRTGKKEGVATLIAAGAKVNGIDNSKSTALHIAAESNNVMLDKVQLLVQAGADVNAKNASGETPLMLAKSRTDDNGPLIVEFLTKHSASE